MLNETIRNNNPSAIRSNILDKTEVIFAADKEKFLYAVNSSLSTNSRTPNPFGTNIVKKPLTHAKLNVDE